MATTITGTTIDVGPNKLVANSAGNVGIGTASPSSKLTSESAAATNIVAKSTNGNGGYMNFQGLASNGTQTFGVNHNGTIFTTSGLAVGGVGANNTLDDYEEGTWTPSFISVNSTSPTGSFAHAGTYTKIGRAVTICCYMQVNSVSVGGGTLAIAGMPFASIDVNGKRGACSLLASTWDNARTEHIGVGIYDSTRLGFLTSSHDAGWNWEQTGSLNAGTNMRFTMTYFTP